MVNNSTNTSITNNQLSYKTSEHKKTTTYGIGKPVAGLVQV
jgi:hypothetical protein